MSFKDKIYKIWSGDYSNEGFEYGLKDGKEGKPKNKLKFFSASNPINWFWAFNNAFNSFSKYYEIGYTEGEKVRHQVYSGIGEKNLKGGKIMSYAVKDYDDAISNLRNLKAKLLSAQGELSRVKEIYNNSLQEAQEKGWMETYIKTMLKKQEVFNEKVNIMIKTIELIKNKIDQDIKQLYSLKQAAQEVK
jgi:hypothetical protein